MPDKRAVRRFPLLLQAHVSGISFDWVRECLVIDISSKGVAFTFPGTPKLHALHTLNITMGKRQQAITCTVKLVWIQEAEDICSYIAGGLFVQVTPGNKKRLLDVARRRFYSLRQNNQQDAPAVLRYFL